MEALAVAGASVAVANATEANRRTDKRLTVAITKKYLLELFVLIICFEYVCLGRVEAIAEKRH